MTLQLTADFDEVDGSLKSWAAWDGANGWLPKFAQEADRSLVYPVREHLFAVTERWMDPDGDGDPADGIDGWRLDVPLEVGDPFWRDWCELVRSINGEAFITGEIWSDWESVARLRGDMFDAQMHYPFAKKALDWMVMKPGMTDEALHAGWDAVFSNDAVQTQLVQQNLYASHDTDRLLSNLANANPARAFDAGNRPQQGEAYDETLPGQRVFELSRLALVMQATYAGAPMVYYGQELGMFGADDPSNRKPMPWSDVGAMDAFAEGPDFTMWSFYREWLNRRKADEVLQLGLVRPILTKRRDVLVFERRLNDEVRLVVVNRGETEFALEELAELVGVEIPAGSVVGAVSAAMISSDGEALGFE